MDLKIDVFWGPEHCIPLGNQPFKRIVTIHDLSVLGNPKLGTRYNYLILRRLCGKLAWCVEDLARIRY